MVLILIIIFISLLSKHSPPKVITKHYIIVISVHRVSYKVYNIHMRCKVLQTKSVREMWEQGTGWE